MGWPSTWTGELGSGKAGTPCSWMTRGGVFTAQGFLLPPIALSVETSWREALDRLLEGGRAPCPGPSCLPHLPSLGNKC